MAAVPAEHIQELDVWRGDDPIPGGLLDHVEGEEGADRVRPPSLQVLCWTQAVQEACRNGTAKIV